MQKRQRKIKMKFYKGRSKTVNDSYLSVTTKILIFMKKKCVILSIVPLKTTHKQKNQQHTSFTFHQQSPPLHRV